MVGRRKFTTLDYAGNLTLAAKTDEEMKQMIKKIQKIYRKSKLTIKKNNVNGKISI